MPSPHRLAFLTPAFVTDTNVGGLASYVLRMSRALLAAGHVPEVFALSRSGPAVIDHGGVRVQLVRPQADRGWMKWCRPATRLWLLRSFRAPLELLSGAAQLAEAFERRDREAPFHLVQSSDYLATGWFVRPRPGRPHVVRCSVARELVAEVDTADSPRMRQWWIRYELEQVRRAAIAYAPSRYAAAYYTRRLGRTIPVVRPPLHLDITPDVPPPPDFPERFLLHFGQLRACKGTAWLLDALPRAWQLAPDLRMAFVGPVRDSALRRRLGELQRSEARLYVHDLLPRPQMYAVLRRATASVLPSLADNLPNTVIESLGLGIPVIGARTASVDELVVEGRHGALVHPGDAAGLAEAMVRTWRGDSPVRRGFIWDAPVAAQMQPRNAVAALGKLAGLDLIDGYEAPEGDSKAGEVTAVCAAVRA